MNYVRKLGFEETPDYDFLRELFTKVLKTLGEPEDGVYDWNELNGGKGWEASNYVPPPPPPHREHRRERERDPNRRRQPADGTTPNQLVLSPTPAHLKSTRRVASNDRNARDLGSVQPIPPHSSRRVSQPKDLGSAGLNVPHPYATAPSPTGYRTSPTPNTYNRHSPHDVLTPNGNGLNGSGSVPYIQHPGRNGSGSPEDTTLPGPIRDGGAKMGLYDLRATEDQDEVHGRRRGFWDTLCCRA